MNGRHSPKDRTLAQLLKAPELREGQNLTYLGIRLAVTRRKRTGAPATS